MPTAALQHGGNGLCGGCRYLLGLAGRRCQPWCFPAAREESFLRLEAVGACKEASQGVLAALAKVSDWGNNTPEFIEENIWEGKRRELGYAAAGLWDQPWGGEASVAAQPLSLF